jgi:hypothetical protein
MMLLASYSKEIFDAQARFRYISSSKKRVLITEEKVNETYRYCFTGKVGRI